VLQERLNGLAILSTESEEVKYSNFEITDEIGWGGGEFGLAWFKNFLGIK